MLKGDILVQLEYAIITSSFGFCQIIAAHAGRSIVGSQIIIHRHTCTIVKKDLLTFRLNQNEVSNKINRNNNNHHHRYYRRGIN